MFANDKSCWYWDESVGESCHKKKICIWIGSENLALQWARKCHSLQVCFLGAATNCLLHTRSAAFSILQPLVCFLSLNASGPG
jgi:hypothetical protein